MHHVDQRPSSPALARTSPLAAAPTPGVIHPTWKESVVILLITMGIYGGSLAVCDGVQAWIDHAQEGVVHPLPIAR